jgi:predicted DNA-binding transcriptional regulator AlpA
VATKTNTLSPARIQLLPRLIRLRDVPFYLGMDKNRFNKAVRPNLTEIPIGDQGIAFDRLEIDHWVDYYIQCNGRPTTPIGEKPWDAKKHQGSPKGASAGTSTKLSKVDAFAKALEQVNSKKPKTSSRT